MFVIHSSTYGHFPNEFKKSRVLVQACQKMAFETRMCALSFTKISVSS